jgi:hypothetical protein
MDDATRALAAHDATVGGRADATDIGASGRPDTFASTYDRPPAAAVRGN